MVLVGITLVTVSVMAIGLIILSSQTQRDIVSDLSGRIQNDISESIKNGVNSLFEWADVELQTARLMFQMDSNLTVPGNGTNPFTAWPSLSEYMWSIVRKKPLGTGVEFTHLDGRLMGLESYNYVSDIYWADYVDDTLYEVGWNVPLNQSVASINKSSDNYAFNFTFGSPYDWVVDTNRGFLTSCQSPSHWFDLATFVGNNGLTWNIISDYITICNSREEMIGYLAVSLGLSSVTKLLQTFTAEDTSPFKGYIFIIDSENQLVASSTDSVIFHYLEDGTPVRITTQSTNEIWIRDVVNKLDGDFQDERLTVRINSTSYFLTVDTWNLIEGIDWRIIQLLEQDQFVGDSTKFYLRSIAAAAVISFCAAAIVLFVTWATTKPLFILANDLQKMAKLDLDVERIDTPRLFEVGRLYRSFTSMNVAMRSFKKFVPVQIISNIIKSEKEVVSELALSQVTVMFQDIEGFTGLSEKMEPMLLAQLTGEYMECMTTIICKHGGTIDKSIGDCIMSLFNAPQEVSDHPKAACSAATECMAALKQRNEEWRKKYGFEMQCRIGINTGEVLVGNLGSVHRMNYTAIGDTVNVAARLEGVNKHFGTRVVISKAVFSNLPRGMFATRKLAKVRVSGKLTATAIYEIRSDVSASIFQLFQFYNSAFTCFKKQDFRRASEFIDLALAIDPQDKPSLHLKARIQTEASRSPLPGDWSYVEDLIKF